MILKFNLFYFVLVGKAGVLVFERWNVRILMSVGSMGYRSEECGRLDSWTVWMLPGIGENAQRI